MSTPQNEAFVEYHRDREARNRAHQTARSAFWTIERLVSGPTGASLLGQLVDASRDTRPEAKNFTNPLETIRDARTASARFGIVHELSAFERFLKASLVDALEFSPHFRKQQPFAHSHADFEATRHRCTGCQEVAWKFVNDHPFTDRTTSLATALDIPLASEEALLPLLRYFWHARNRIAHDDGFSGERLVEYSRSDELKTAVAHWNKKYSRRPAPELPLLEKRERISFLHEHAILCGAIGYRFARTLTEALVQAMGERAMILMATYYAYFSSGHPHRSKMHTRPDQAVSNFLVYRYRYADVGKRSLIARMRSLGLWDLARDGYRAVYLKRP